MTKEKMKLNEKLSRGMYKLTISLVKKTSERMEKEAKISGTTLKMASLTKELFLAVRTWGIDV